MNSRNNKLNLFISVIIVVSMSLSLASPLIPAKAATSDYAGGSGTRFDPFLIETIEQLTNICKNKGTYKSHYRLISDLDFSSITKWNGLDRNGQSYFYGTLDGDNHIISNMTAVGSGLFNRNYGTIKNIQIRNYCSSSANTAKISAMIATTNYGVIEYCGVDGFVSGVFVGAISGYNEGTITRCWSSASVSAISSLKIGAQTETSCAGGIVGNNSGIVDNCYNLGVISGVDDGCTGGLVGRGNIPSRSYNIGIVNIGGAIIGAADSSDPDGSSCYYLDNNTTGAHWGTDIAFKCSDSAMKDKQTFATLDFNTTWDMGNDSNYPYPVLKEELAIFSGGTGKINNPYLISTKNELSDIRNYPGACYLLTTNIVFSDDDFAPGGQFYNEGKGWTPIESFQGIFDGNGYCIFNLQTFQIPNPDQIAPTIGLFGDSSETIKNLTIRKAKISNTVYRSYIGCIVGLNTGLVENCQVLDSQLTINAGYGVGGIVGWNSGTIRNCLNDSTIIGPTDCSIGGICGRNGSGSKTSLISFCVNKGLITIDTSYSGEVKAGGIVGENNLDGIVESSSNLNNISVIVNKGYSAGYAAGVSADNAGTIKMCYNSGDISISIVKQCYAGGIVANNNEGQILDSYNYANISAEKSNDSQSLYVGGIIGYNKSTKTSTNCYSIGDIKAPEDALSFSGYICGYDTLDTMKNSYYPGPDGRGSGHGSITTLYCVSMEDLMKQTTFRAFDFTSIWTMAGNESYPYPELRSVVMEYQDDFVKSISVDTLPTKTKYIQTSESLDMTGGRVTLHYNSGKTETISLSSCQNTGFDNTKLGKQTITVSYSGFTTSYVVEIVARTVVELELTSLPNKLVYTEGESFVSDGMKITAFYNDNTSELVTEYQLSGYSSTPGDKIITVSYYGKTTSFMVDVKAKVSITTATPITSQITQPITSPITIQSITSSMTNPITDSPTNTATDPETEPGDDPVSGTPEIITNSPEPDTTTIFELETNNSQDPESDVTSVIATEASPDVSTAAEDSGRENNEMYLTMILLGALVAVVLVGAGVFVGIIIAKKKN